MVKRSPRMFRTMVWSLEDEHSVSSWNERSVSVILRREESSVVSVPLWGLRALLLGSHATCDDSLEQADDGDDVIMCKLNNNNNTKDNKTTAIAAATTAAATTTINNSLIKNFKCARHSAQFIG